MPEDEQPSEDAAQRHISDIRPGTPGHERIVEAFRELEAESASKPKKKPPAKKPKKKP